jgi:hypothetical protein
MATRNEPSRKVVDKHAKFLAAWEAAGYPDKFEFEGTSLNNGSDDGADRRRARATDRHRW